MVAQALFLLLFLLLGAAYQRAAGGDRLRDWVWLAYFWTIAPLLVFVTFLTLAFDRELASALLAAIVATWLVAAAGYLYASIVATARDERGALALAAGFGNTGFVGLPLAQLAFGAPGLALAVVYDRLCWLVPSTSVSTVVARLHGRRSLDVRPGNRLRAFLLNPPLLALVLALALRAGGVEVAFADEARALAAALVGPVGFFLLGLALPLELPAHGRVELHRAAGALAIRFAGGPLALGAVGALVGAHIPLVFYLLAGMPASFHLLVLARIYDLRPALMRLLVVGSTLAAVTVVPLAATLAH